MVDQAVTMQELYDAKADADALEAVVNGGVNRPNPGHEAGTVTTRLGLTMKTLARTLYDLSAEGGVVVGDGPFGDVTFRNTLRQTSSYWKRSKGTLDLPGIKIIDDGKLTLTIKNRLGQPLQSVSFGPGTTVGSGGTSTVPIFNPGKQSAWHAEAAKFGYTGVGQPHILVIGDSWAEYLPTAQALRGLLNDEYTSAGHGWIGMNSSGSGAPYSPVTLVRADWTIYDASTDVAPLYNAGLDGITVNTTGTTATIALAGLPDPQLKIFYGRQGGKFRYRVNGGSYTTVTADSTGGLGVVTLTGLTVGSTVDIDTVGNTGTAVIHGFFSSNPSANGVIVSKAGNAGLQSYDYDFFVNGSIPGIAAEILPDHAIVLIGTNDYRGVNSPPATSVQALRNMVAAFRTVVPGMGFTFVVPAQTTSDIATVNPLSLYRDLFYQELCLTDGHGLYNMLDHWSDWQTMYDMGLWNSDGLHPNGNGGYLLANTLNTNFLSL